MRSAKVVTALAIAFSSVVAAQSIRIGWPANPQATDDVFVLRYFDTATGQGFGTLPGTYAAAATRATSQLADIAVVGLAGGVQYGALDSSGASMTASEVTWNALSVLRIKPALGRDFVEAEAKGGKVLAILTHATWLSRYQGRADAVGSRFVRTNVRYGWRDEGQIIGVLPPGVFAATPELDPAAQVLVLSTDLLDGSTNREGWYSPLIRPRPGVTAGQTQTALNAAISRLQPTGAADFGLRLESLRSQRH
ncbi:MAG TPA: ABC transporter permease [Vicinamibacterales bacterium]|nr:ABC transporter permease [Vicinamibacterales bacterium]